MKQTTSDDSRDVLLIVDDEEQVVLLLSTILSQDGYRCETARDGREAKRILTRSPGDFSTVILDWAMPEMSGIEVLGWMKGEPDLRDLPVIMHSGLINPDHIREGIDAGAFYYLTKPSSHTVLRSVVRAAIVEHNERESLKRKLKDCENPFRYVEEATFRIRTVTDAEFLALRLANASANPEDAIHVAELLNNAIEHGNLKISYDEKTALVEQGIWVKEVERRLDLPEHRGKFVRVTVSREDGNMVIVIEDRGEGFDYERYLRMDEQRVFDNHGRGIAIAASFLKIEFLNGGNTARVILPAPAEPPFARP